MYGSLAPPRVRRLIVPSIQGSWLMRSLMTALLPRLGARFIRGSAHIVLLLALLFDHPAWAQTPPLPVVSVMPVPVQDVSASSEFVGRVEAVNAVDIRARVEGFIQERPFEEGQTVKEGQVLFVIETAGYQASLSAAQASLAGAQATLQEAERSLQRNQQLSQNQTVSQATLEQVQAARDTARANVMAAQANVRQAELNLGYTKITSPITGRIGRAAFAVGSLVGPSSDPLARVVQTDPIRVVFSVSDQVILQLRAELPDASDEELSKRFVPTLRLSTGTEYPIKGSIEFVGNEIDPQTGTVPVWAQFANPQSLLVPGQFVTMVVRPAEAQRSPVVPVGALQQDREGRFVLTVGDDNKVSMQRIRVSRQVGQNWVVEEGLKGGERLIVQGLQNARPGATVETVQAQADPAPAGGTAAQQSSSGPAGSTAR
jgi:membrane fusion protein (multidrug efflux system)